LLFCCIAIATARFVPYGSAYGHNILYFFNRDDGYSTAYHFPQIFLLGCTSYRRFWVRCTSVIFINGN